MDYVKNMWRHRKDLKVEDAGIVALFGLECFAWFCAGEIVGRGYTITGYYPWITNWPIIVGLIQGEIVIIIMQVFDFKESFFFGAEKSVLKLKKASIISNQYLNSLTVE